MNRSSKKHHFVTQAQLRHFAADTEQRFIYGFSKKSDRSFHTSILNAGSENDFNTVSFGDEKWNFEELFQEVDTRSARLIAEIIACRSLAWLTPEDHIALADLFATQLLRTHFSRKTPKYMAEQLREMVRQIGYNPDDDPHMVMPSDAMLRLNAVRMFLDRSSQVAALLRLHPVLYVSDGKYRFIISDHPICLVNAFPYGDGGLTSLGIIALLPISPDITIALHCPTIIERYELVENADLDTDQKARMLHYRDGLRSGEPIIIDSDMVLKLNLYQVTQSTGYLYSATDDFNFARKILKEHDELRTAETHVKMGKIGCAPPPRPGMPAGIHLVIFGSVDHCMLEIDEIDEAGEGLTARTQEVDLLSQIAADKGMLRVELYIDRQVTHMMGQAMIECIDELSSGWFRVVHRDPSLRALSVQLDAKCRLE